MADTVKRVAAMSMVSFSPQPVAENARKADTDDGADKGTAHIPALLEGVESEQMCNLRDGSRDDGCVVAEEESTEGGYHRQEGDVAYIDG